MKYIEYKEKRLHGTKSFPFAYYHLTSTHPRYNMIYHWHTECEIIHIISGSFTLSLDGEAIKLSAGDCAFAGPGVLHGGVPLECEYECLVFDVGALAKTGGICSKSVNPIIEHNRKITTFFAKESYFAKRCRDIMEQMRQREDFYEFSVLGQTLLLFGEILRNGDFADNTTTTNTRIKKLRMFKTALAFIEEHYSEDLSLESIADVCSLNANYFCRSFKELTGKTPMEYLNYYRIESACELIASTDKPLIDIALLCGYNDYSYFIKVFKKYKGITPHKYSTEMV